MDSMACNVKGISENGRARYASLVARFRDSVTVPVHGGRDRVFVGRSGGMGGVRTVVLPVSAVMDRGAWGEGGEGAAASGVDGWVLVGRGGSNAIDIQEIGVPVGIVFDIV